MTRSDVHCTNCGGTFIAELDLSLNGNHEITCPLCQHIHFRVVRDGEVTEDRYRSSAGPTIVAFTTATTVSTAWVASSNASTGGFLTGAWLNTTNIGTGSS